MRRVVTGVDTHGKSVIIDDTVVEPTSARVMPGSRFVQLWGSDDAVALPSDGREPAWTKFFPPVTGFRFLVWTIPPESTPAPAIDDVAAAIDEVERVLPGVIEFNEREHPGMHTTDTVDLDLVIAGEVWMELDDGAEVHLRTGDCVIQNGTRHAWHNRSDAPATIVTALVGARRA